MTRREPFAWAKRAAKAVGLGARAVEQATLWRYCPPCGSDEGAFCTTEYGRTSYTPHAARVRAAIRRLSPPVPVDHSGINA